MEQNQDHLAAASESGGGGALLPCPFCGASRTVELWSRFDAGHIAHLHCEGCGANGPSLYSEHSADVAIKLARYSWNGRSQSYRQGDKIRPVR